MAFKKRVQTIFEWIEPSDDKLILDMPCGRGFYLNMIRYVSQCKLVGAELDWDVILKAQAQRRQRCPISSLNNCNIYALPYPDNTFDAVILSEILEHIDDDVAGLKEIYRVLKPGGVVAITVPNANYPVLVGSDQQDAGNAVQAPHSARARSRASGRTTCGCTGATNCATRCWARALCWKKSAPLRTTASRSSIIWSMASASRCWNRA